MSTTAATASVPLVGPNPRVGVGALVLSRSRPGYVLLGRRLNAHGHGTYALPGGHLDYGESIETCAVRETEEETALRTTDCEWLWVVNNVFHNDNSSSSNKHYVTIFCRCYVCDSDNNTNTAAAAAAVAVNTEPDRCESWSWVLWSDVVAGVYLPLFSPLLSLTQAVNFDPFKTGAEQRQGPAATATATATTDTTPATATATATAASTQA